jgi:hypothetical protein
MQFLVVVASATGETTWPLFVAFALALGVLQIQRPQTDDRSQREKPEE